MRRLAVPLMLALSLPIFAADDTKPITPADAKVLSEFTAFVDRVLPQERRQFQTFIDRFIEEPTGVHVGGRKHLFSGWKVDAVPETYFFDVQKTDSIVAPYRGVLEFPIVFLRVQMWVRGYKQSCNRKTIDVCLADEGEIIEDSNWYKGSARPYPHRVQHEYLYQGGEWKPKIDIPALLRSIVSGIRVQDPIPSSRVPGLFGIPTPTATQTPPPG